MANALAELASMFRQLQERGQVEGYRSMLCGMAHEIGKARHMHPRRQQQLDGIIASYDGQEMREASAGELAAAMGETVEGALLS